MTNLEITAELLKAKQVKSMSFQDLGKLLGRDPMWVAALIYRQATASEDEASKLAQVLDLPPEITQKLTEYPVKGSLDPVIPTDPLIYRFYEIMQVYGMPLKALIQEEFGDGIMSAIDFTLNVEKETDPKGVGEASPKETRVKITMSGKFLPYKKW